MKRLLLILSIVMLFMVGCSGKNDGNEKFKAMVVKSYESGLMAINLDKELSIGMFDPISVGYKNKLTLETGDIVEIKFDGLIRESYPVQITASNVKLIEKAEGGWPASAMIPKDYTYEDAVLDKNLVVGHSEVEGKDHLNIFVGNSVAGMVSFLRVVAYTIEGDPIIKDILFDGKTYYGVHDNTRDAFGSQSITIYEYPYLNTYEKDGKLVVYLANRNDITDEEFEKSMESDREEDRIDMFVIYEEYVAD